MESTIWYEDAGCWTDMHDVLFNKTRMRNSFIEVNKLIRLTQLSPGGAVLDLCCGIGRHSAEFARRGYAVTGVDLTERYLDSARSDAARESLDIRYVRSDMREFCEPDSFDLIINMFTSFGYFEQEKDDATVAANAWRSLKKNGRLVIEVMGKEVIAAGFRERDWQRLDGYILMAENRILDDWGWIECKWTMIRDDSMKTVTYSHKLYSATELRRILLEAGFGKVDIYGDLMGSPYDHNAKVMLVVAEK